MEKGNNNKIVILLLIAIIGILSVLCILFATDTISFKSNNIDNNELSNENIDSENNSLNDDVIEDNKIVNIDEALFIRKTRITLIDESNCTWYSSPLVANIEPSGSISIGQGGGAVGIYVNNAKYLYKVSLVPCDTFKLYFITEDKELYVVDNSNYFAGKATKVTESNIIEFLGEEHKDDGSYLKVLTKNKTIEYIKYFSIPY